MTIKYRYSKNVIKFFNKHTNLKETFKNDVKKHLKGEKVDIKKLQGYDDLMRIRIGKYRIIFLVSKNEITIVDVIAERSRGDIYKKIK